jgi:hypothetical protein
MLRETFLKINRLSMRWHRTNPDTYVHPIDLYLVCIHKTPSDFFKPKHTFYFAENFYATNQETNVSDSVKKGQPWMYSFICIISNNADTTINHTIHLHIVTKSYKNSCRYVMEDECHYLNKIASFSIKWLIIVNRQVSSFIFQIHTWRLHAYKHLFM